MNSDLFNSVEPIRSNVKTEIKNFGSPLSPSYSIQVEIEQFVREDPDLLHQLLTETGLVSRETIPFEIVSNLRGSIDGKPFYSALILHEGSLKRYQVGARDTGGLLKLKITYEPVIYPEEMRLIHPAEFARLKIKVLEWELHNYRHHFILLISSRRYEHFDIWVNALENGTSVRISLYEAGLREKRPPCPWYLTRLGPFKGLEEEVKERIGAYNE